MPLLLVGGAVGTEMGPQDETLPGLQGLPAPLQSFVPTERFPSEPGRVERELGTECPGQEGPAPHRAGKTSPMAQRAWPGPGCMTSSGQDGCLQDPGQGCRPALRSP
ncbi:PREDICTED: dexamethasone-induced protein isoform X1 [Chinchilla lanigera]|uniref:dexamethasone-induced protein isoform X1 n=1 Tax=Chinchilla lanigera TaxID=34839 RepID=UPI00069610A4|nr:PREDICTED: dexamethasone-induced protein isoform X1 [Chinchilla lanigera]